MGVRVKGPERDAKSFTGAIDLRNSVLMNRRSYCGRCSKAPHARCARRTRVASESEVKSTALLIQASVLQPQDGRSWTPIFP